jgi:integrase
MAVNCFERELTLLSDTVRAKAPTSVPIVLLNQETTAIISELKPRYHLMVSLLYGSGLRKAELLRLRIKDIDFGGNSIYVFRGKGAKDRITLLPQVLIEPLKSQINKVEAVHNKDLA